MTNIKKVKGYMPVPARFKHLDEQRRNIERALNSIPAGSDEHVAVSAVDTTPGFLEDKLTQGAGITLTPSGAGNETLEISSAAGTDEEVGVTALDTTPGFLGAKIRFDLLYFDTSTTFPLGGNQRLEISPLIDNIVGPSIAPGSDFFPTHGSMAGQYLRCRYPATGNPKHILVLQGGFDLGAEITFFIEDDDGQPVTINTDVNVNINYFSAAGGALVAAPSSVGPQFAGKFTAITMKLVRISATDTWDAVGNIA